MPSIDVQMTRLQQEITHMLALAVMKPEQRPGDFQQLWEHQTARTAEALIIEQLGTQSATVGSFVFDPANQPRPETFQYLGWLTSRCVPALKPFGLRGLALVAEQVLGNVRVVTWYGSPQDKKSTIALLRDALDKLENRKPDWTRSSAGPVGRD